MQILNISPDNFLKKRNLNQTERCVERPGWYSDPWKPQKKQTRHTGTLN